MKKRTKSNRAPAVQGPSPADERRWRAEEDLRVLRRAEEVKSDKSRLTAAKRMADEEMRALARVKGRR